MVKHVHRHQRHLHSRPGRHTSTSERRSSTPDPRPSTQRLFHGVRMRSWGRWVSEIRIPNSRRKIWLGSYATSEQAARAFDAASLLLRRPFPLNFSDSASLLHLPHFDSAASSLPSRRSIQVAAQLAALSAPPAQEVASTSCTVLDPSYFNLEAVRADLNASAYVKDDSSWMEELRSLLAPEEPGTVSSAGSSLSSHGVFDAAAISLSFDVAAPCSAAAAGKLQDKVLMNKEYEEAFQEMVSVDGFTATSAVVTTRARIDVDPIPSHTDKAPLWTLQ